MPRKKRTNPETGLIVVPPQPAEAIVLQVKTWIVEGQQPADIMEAIAEHFPQERPDVLLSASLAALASEAANIDQDLARGFLLNAYRDLYRRAFEISDFGSALAALRSFERVTGV